ncbi:MAG: sirohydrochlorin cobaltochelatase, partial [Lachnospiraceae bacterium]|nr:sirohydrochlorin cobaltochelatase [Lachnospiraceae bacterium]
MKKAILVVSFGTSHADTREKTLDVLEQDLAAAYPDFTVYRAWTSRMILRKLAERDGIHICDVPEAMAQMNRDGVEALVVQPTHIINGVENDRMKEDVQANRGNIRSISFGAPLLTTTEDSREAIQAVMVETAVAEDEALVWMGHGTTHYANTVYAAMDYMFKDMGYKNVFLGTVEAYPAMESLLRQVKAYSPRRVILAPFMVVAGEHAKNDMSGE